MLCLCGGVVLFLPLFTMPIFLLHVVLCLLGFFILWLSFGAHKHASLLLRSYKELKEKDIASVKKNNYV
jgi:hypothetical protein